MAPSYRWKLHLLNNEYAYETSLEKQIENEKYNLEQFYNTVNKP